MKKEIIKVNFNKKTRGTWGLVNPITKIIPDKTKYSRKSKYKKEYQ